MLFKKIINLRSEEFKLNENVTLQPLETKIIDSSVIDNTFKRRLAALQNVNAVKVLDEDLPDNKQPEPIKTSDNTPEPTKTSESNKTSSTTKSKNKNKKQGDK